MDILGIGPLELIVILLVALAVFGPDRLPAIGAKLGRAMRDMRRATREFSREIEAARKAVEAPLNEIKEPLQQIGGAVQGAATLAQAARNPGQALRDAVVRELSAGPTAEDAPQAADAPASEPDQDAAAIPFTAAQTAPSPPSDTAPAGDTRLLSPASSEPAADEQATPEAETPGRAKLDSEEAP